MAVVLILVLIVVGSVLFHVLSPWWWTPIASNWTYIDTTLVITFWITGAVFVAMSAAIAPPSPGGTGGPVAERPAPAALRARADSDGLLRAVDAVMVLTTRDHTLQLLGVVWLACFAIGVHAG